MLTFGVLCTAQSGPGGVDNDMDTTISTVVKSHLLTFLIFVAVFLFQFHEIHNFSITPRMLVMAVNGTDEKGV